MLAETIDLTSDDDNFDIPLIGRPRRERRNKDNLRVHIHIFNPPDDAL